MSKFLITFDMNTSCLKDNYHGNNYNNAYADIKNVLAKHGFDNFQGSVYMGHDEVSEAHGTVAIQELTARFDWFYSCVSNIRFLRIESDLKAQFIADGVHQAKQDFLGRVERLRKSLEQAGMAPEKIKQVVDDQRFELEHLKP